MSYKLPARRLVSQQDAALIERPDIPRSRFLGQWTWKSTFNAGLLIPFLADEVLPGDSLSYDVTAYVRMATPLFPMFDNQRIDTHFFFVPNRLVWSNWRRMMGEQPSPGDSIDFQVPVVTPGANGGFPVGSLADYFGLPTVGQIDPSSPPGDNGVSSLPFKMYNLIYNEWFRDENLVAPAPVLLTDGTTVINSYPVRRRAKSHDYFTSALPWPQKFAAPNVPLTGLAPIQGLGTTGTAYSLNAATIYQTPPEPQLPPNTVFTQGPTTLQIVGSGPSGDPQVFADLSAATATFTIQTLREGFLVQQLLERDARGGTRYIEILKSHFGVNSPDARLQRPEYIGGGMSPLVVTPIAQTAPAGSSVVGQLGAAATATGSHRASYASTEHGYIIGLISVKSELSYQQGIERHWSRRTRYDFYWPALAGLGEQAIRLREIFATGIPTADNTIFGFQERWHEYRSKESRVTGRFRSYVPGTLDAWHLSQRFITPPVLGQTFIEDSPPMARVLAAGSAATTNNIEYIADVMIKRTAVRPIPTYGTPVMLGRF